MSRILEFDGRLQLCYNKRVIIYHIAIYFTVQTKFVKIINPKVLHRLAVADPEIWEQG